MQAGILIHIGISKEPAVTLTWKIRRNKCAIETRNRNITVTIVDSFIYSPFLFSHSVISYPAIIGNSIILPKIHKGNSNIDNLLRVNYEDGVFVSGAGGAVCRDG
jgi:hypothetical protein